MSQDSGAEDFHTSEARDIAMYKRQDIKMEPSRGDISMLLLSHLNHEVIIVSCLPQRPVSKINKVV